MLEPNEIVLYRCPNGHVTGIPFREHQAGKVRCTECEKNGDLDEIIRNIRKILSECGKA